MIPKSGYRFSDRIMLKQEDLAGNRWAARGPAHCLGNATTSVNSGSAQE
jgi:hypothetical protein